MENWQKLWKVCVSSETDRKELSVSLGSSPRELVLVNMGNNLEEAMQLDLSEHDDSIDSVKSVFVSPMKQQRHPPGLVRETKDNSNVHYQNDKQETCREAQQHVDTSTLCVTTENGKSSHREVERKRRMTIASKVEQLRGLLPCFHRTRKADVASTLSATVEYLQSTIEENERLKAQVATLKEEMRQLQQPQETNAGDWNPKGDIETCRAAMDQQVVSSSSCHYYKGPLKIDYSFPWTRYIPPNACNLTLATREDLQRSCQILQLLSTIKNCYAFICDIQGHLVWLSDSVKDVLGYQPEALLGRDVWSLLHPEDLDAVYPLVQTWHEVGFTSSVHLRRKRADGSYVELKSSFTNLLNSNNGEVEGCVCMETIVEGSSDRWLEAIYKLDLNGKLTYASPSVERMTGYRVDEIIGRQYTFNVHRDEQELIENNLRRMIFADTPVNNDVEAPDSISSRFKNKASQTMLSWFRRIAKSGNDIWLVSLTVASQETDSSQFAGFISIEHDITMHVERWACVLDKVSRSDGLG